MNLRGQGLSAPEQYRMGDVEAPSPQLEPVRDSLSTLLRDDTTELAGMAIGKPLFAAGALLATYCVTHVIALHIAGVASPQESVLLGSVAFRFTMCFISVALIIDLCPKTSDWRLKVPVLNYAAALIGALIIYAP